MSLLRRFDSHHKLYASFALLLCLSMGLSFWMLGQLGQMSTLVQPGRAVARMMEVRLILWLALGVTLAATAMLALWLRGEVDRPVHEAATMARRVAGGDLSSHIGLAAAGEAGELLDSMQQMNDNLAGMIVKVRAGTESIAGSAGQFAACSMVLTARTEQQVGSIEETSARAKQRASAIRDHAGDVQHANKLANSAFAAALTATAAVAEVMESMTSIHHASTRIAAISGVVDSLASQADVLALSAAVEAARDGAQGRGRAALAAEVRTLAQRSANFAKDLRMLIDDSLNQSSAGKMLADKAGKTMHELTARVDLVTASVGGIADAGAAHGDGLEQLNADIAAIEQAARQTAALVAQSTAAAASMRDQAGSLSRATAAFVLGPEYGVRPPAIRLVSSNPGRLVQTRSVVGGAARLTTVQAGTSVLPTPRLVRGRVAAARRDVEWDKF